MSSNLYDKTTHKLIPIAGNSESTAASLGSLSDVVITSPTNGQHLTFDLATSQWKNSDAPLPTIEVNDLSDVTIISVSNGQILKWNSTTTKWENSSFNDITSLGAIPNVDISQVQDGDILVYDTTSGKWINTALDMSDYQTKNLSSFVESASTVEGALGTLSSNKMSWSDNSVLGAKNLLPNIAHTDTVYGVTFTINSDGSVDANGTATDLAYIDIASTDMGFSLADGSYILSDGLVSHSADYYTTITIVDNQGNVTYEYADTKAESHMAFTITNSNISKLYVAVCVADGITANNVLFKPMIRLADDNDGVYEPYAMTNKQITPYVQAISNPNLLDNPWFTVNQRGWTTGGATKVDTFTVDRWKIEVNNSDHVVTVNNDGTITLTNNSSVGMYFDTAFLLKDFLLDVDTSYTASVDVVSYSGVVNVNIGLMNSSPWHRFGNIVINKTGINSATGVVPSDFTGTSFRALCFILNAGASITVRAVKLERGTVSTLAMDTIPNYQKELAKCQRYFYKTMITTKSDSQTTSKLSVATNTNFLTGVDFPVQMRDQPAYSNVKAQDFFGTVLIDNIVFETSTKDGVCRFYKQNAFTQGTWYYMQFEASADI